MEFDPIEIASSLILLREYGEGMIITKTHYNQFLKRSDHALSISRNWMTCHNINVGRNYK